jgi:hypothetical protein
MTAATVQVHEEQALFEQTNGGGGLPAGSNRTRHEPAEQQLLGEPRSALRQRS